MDEVKLLVINPEIFCIIDHELEVWWYTNEISVIGILEVFVLFLTYRVGWPGLRSVPMT